MNLKRTFMLLFFALILFFGISIYKSYFNGFEIVNKTNETINLSIVSENNKSIEDISIQKLSTKTIKLPKNENIINVMYYYNNKQSVESFEIYNKEINSKYSKMIISSIDNNKPISEFK